MRINDKSSSLSSVSVGVPQGSVLGPVLFLIYINDVHTAIPGTELLLYADDTSKFHSHNDLKGSFTIG